MDRVGGSSTESALSVSINLGNTEPEPTGVNKVLNTESEIEALRQKFLEDSSLELETDEALTEEVVQKGVLAKCFGRNPMQKSKVRQILSRVWRLRSKWWIKTLEEGLWGIFFDSKEDLEEVLNGRPWLLGGQILNLIEWPEDGGWQKVQMDIARVWVQVHGLPTPYLAWQNAQVVGAKIGKYVKFDKAEPRVIARRGFLKLMVEIPLLQRILAGFFLSFTRDMKEWIQFKYFPLHGSWLKANSPIRNCFDTRPPAMAIRRDAGPKMVMEKLQKMNLGSSENEEQSEEAAELIDNRGSKDSTTRTSSGAADRGSGSVQHPGDKRMIGTIGTSGLPNSDTRSGDHPIAKIGRNPKDKVILSLMPNVRPFAAQMIELPHHKVCKSRTPHVYLEPISVEWAEGTSLEEVIRDVLVQSDVVEAQISISLENEGLEAQVARVRETSFECWVSDPYGGKDWTLFAIYGTPYKEQKDDFWEEVASYVKRCQSPWAVVGDLNVILEKDDKYGGRMVSYRDCEILSSFLEETRGIDLGFHGCKFTWRNKRDNGKLIRERIDRVLVDTDWLTLYSKAGVRNLPIVASDHGPILFDSLMCKRRGSGIFRFYEAQFREESCLDVIKEAWFMGGDQARLVGSLKKTKNALQIWSKRVFCDTEKNLQKLEERLSLLQSHKNWEEIAVEEAQIQLRLKEEWARNELCWKQRSRELRMLTAVGRKGRRKKGLY
uniref:DUF4283 domain-containing protein n=1 Tax=Cannabis sativa TaxID=3483 RepID=A0A803NPG3_CANSA